MIAVAMSGGLDSFAAAYILKKQKHDLIGIHFITGFENNVDNELDQLNKTTRGLSIDLHVIDCSEEFKKSVVDYFIESYGKGLTPNPCIICNAAIKFGLVLEHAKKLGAIFLATGHYAQTKQTGFSKTGLFKGLFKGIDKSKDQSYFLAMLRQDQIQNALFPLGEMTKEDVKKMISEQGVNINLKKESQEVCFIKNNNYADFLEKSKKITFQKGPILNTQGIIIGEHNGLHAFTTGQRKGINCPASHPYYVIKINQKDNSLIVGTKKDLFSKKCIINNINWIHPEIPFPCDKPLEINVKVRYRHKEVQANLYSKNTDKAIIEFNDPQMAVTPGQGAVFYIGDMVAGGGFISHGIKS